MGTVPTDLLLAEHAPALKNFLGARCRDADLAADLMQEVAARLLATAPRLYSNGNARGYLFRVATSVWHDHLRREVVRRRAAEVMASGEPALAGAADEALIAEELGAAIRRAVAALPPAQREVLELRHRVSGALTFREIAERLGRPLGTVLTQMRAALAKIAAELEDYR
jgi:RNA polymerase sigma-70 factor (ECF subfamily)